MLHSPLPQRAQMPSNSVTQHSSKPRSRSSRSWAMTGAKLSAVTNWASAGVLRARRNRHSAAFLRTTGLKVPLVCRTAKELAGQVRYGLKRQVALLL